MLLQGTHVPRNPSKALTYFQRALDRGVAASANALGVMHAVGVGVPASMAVARSWFEQGANMSSSEAYFNLGTIYLHGEGCLSLSLLLLLLLLSLLLIIGFLLVT
jgi:TPR repeat protein